MSECCSRNAGSPVGTYTCAMLVALANLQYPCQHLRVTEMHWQPFLSNNDWAKYPPLLGNVFSCLLSLELKATPYASNNRELEKEELDIEKLQLVLRSATIIERLSLCIQQLAARPDHYGFNSRKLVDRTESLFYNRLLDRRPDHGRIPARLTWSPKLSHLELAGIVCTSKELKLVLENCSQTLHTLKLYSVGLMPQEEKGARACFVDLFKWMQKHLELEEITLEGLLVNGGMQAWEVRSRCWAVEPPAAGWLRDRVHEFILRGGACPLDHVAVPPGYFDVYTEDYITGTLTDLTLPEFGGDESWRIEYQEIHETYGERESDMVTSSSFYNDSDYDDENEGAE